MRRCLASFACIAILIGCRSSDGTEAKLAREEPGLYETRTGLFTLFEGSSRLVSFRYGPKGLLPIAGDWDGDGGDSVGLYSPVHRTFLLSNFNVENVATSIVELGGRGRNPVAGDWDGDGKDGVGAFDPSSMTFFLSDGPEVSNRRTVRLEWDTRQPSLPVAGDWDGSGRAGVGVYLPTEGRFLLRGAAGKTSVIGGAPRLGLPAAADVDGDGRSEPLVLDRSFGTLWRYQDRHGFVEDRRLGTTSALPLFGRWSLSTAIHALEMGGGFTRDPPATVPPVPRGSP